MKWNRVEDKQPPTGVRILVYKYYLDEEFDLDLGMYNGVMIKTISRIGVDTCHAREGYGEKLLSWEDGGVVTHWLKLPEEPRNE